MLKALVKTGEVNSSGLCAMTNTFHDKYLPSKVISCGSSPRMNLSKKEEGYLLITNLLLLDHAKIGVKYIGYDPFFFFFSKIYIINLSKF